MPEATGKINRSNTICHYTRFFRFLESNCNGCNVGDPKMVELLHLFAENGLDVDTTVKPLYGHQQDAKVGYNPTKPGRPSHAYHSYFVANIRMVLDMEVQAGNQTAP